MRTAIQRVKAPGSRPPARCTGVGPQPRTGRISPAAPGLQRQSGSQAPDRPPTPPAHPSQRASTRSETTHYTYHDHRAQALCPLSGYLSLTRLYALAPQTPLQVHWPLATPFLALIQASTGTERLQAPIASWPVPCVILLARTAALCTRCTLLASLSSLAIALVSDQSCSAIPHDPSLQSPSERRAPSLPFTAPLAGKSARAMNAMPTPCTPVSEPTARAP